MLGRGCPCREPARRRSRHGALWSIDRRGDRGGQARQAPQGRDRPNVPGACSWKATGRRAGLPAGAAAPGLARAPGLAATAGGGIGAAMGLTDPTGPGGDGDAVEIGGPLPAAWIEMARSGCAHGEPCAAQEAAREQEPSTGPGGGAGAAGRPPKAAGEGRRGGRGRGGGEESQEEPLVFGDDDEDLPTAKLAAAGATADPVKDYLKQIGKVPLLNARQEVELAKRIEAGMFAEEKLAEGS